MSNSNYSQSIFEAYKDNKSLNKENFPFGINLDEAYFIQHSFTKLKGMNNEYLKGYKISMTSPETQGWFNANEPLYGQMTDTQKVSTVSLSRDTTEPLIELELVFIVTGPINAESTILEITNNTKIAPGLEIPDSRFVDWFPKITKEHICADAAVSGKICFGDAKIYDYSMIDNIKGKLLLNGELIDEGSSSVVMGHPINALCWLIKKLESHNLRLEEGMFVTAGTLVLPKRLEKGLYEGIFENVGKISLKVLD